MNKPAPTGRTATAATPAPAKEFAANGAAPPVTLANDGTPIATSYTKEEELARILCQSDGYQLDGYFMGEERWRGYLLPARSQIAAFDFLTQLREGEQQAADVG